jgi:hypothetical protein
MTRAFAAGATVPLVLGSAPVAPAPTAPAPPRRPGAIAAFAAGALGLTAAAIFGGLALSKRSDLQAVCGVWCPHTAQPAIDTMNTFANVSTAGAVVAGAGAAVGTILWVTAPSGAAGRPVGPSGVSFRASF